MNKKTTYYQKNKKKLLHRANKYDESKKERFQEQARNTYRKLSNKKPKHEKRIWKKLISKYA